MTDRRLRTIPFALGEPAANLALDAALLEIAGPPTLRLYGWRPAGLSIGRFQDADAFRGLPGEHQLVRRSTGGGAIWHGDEITFALTLDDRPDWTIDRAYEAVHDAVVRALGRVGLRARRLGRDTPCGPCAGSRATAWCFAQPARHDVVADAGPRAGAKLCGSAQRRLRRPIPRVLHHGSIPLTRPAATPFAAAVADQVDATTVRQDLLDALVGEFARELGVEPYAGSLSEAERRRAAELAPSFRVEAGVRA